MPVFSGCLHLYFHPREATYGDRLGLVVFHSPLQGSSLCPPHTDLGYQSGMIEDDDEIAELIAELMEQPPDEVWRRLEGHPQAEILLEMLEEEGFPMEEVE